MDPEDWRGLKDGIVGGNPLLPDALNSSVLQGYFGFYGEMKIAIFDLEMYLLLFLFSFPDFIQNLFDLDSPNLVHTFLAIFSRFDFLISI